MRTRGRWERKPALTIEVSVPSGGQAHPSSSGRRIDWLLSVHRALSLPISAGNLFTIDPWDAAGPWWGEGGGGEEHRHLSLSRQPSCFHTVWPGTLEMISRAATQEMTGILWDATSIQDS